MKKVTIGSAHYGGGHDSLAVILSDIINQLNIPYKQYESSVYYLHGKKASFSYRFFGPTSLYNKTFYKTNNLIGREILLSLLNIIVEREIKKLIKQQKPDLFLAVHPFYTKILSKFDISYIMFVTDPFSVHAVWAELEAKKIVVFTREAKKRLIKLLVTPNNIIVSKFPLRRQFYEKYDRKKLRQDLNIKNKTLTLVIGGSGEGMESAARTCQILHKSKLNFKAFVVCGKNVLLKTRMLTRLFKDKRFVIIGYQENMAALLTASDLFVGKVGANILFECLATKTPIIATLPLLAQEEGNRDFVLKKDIGWVENDYKKIVNIVKECLNNPSVLTKKSYNMQHLKRTYLAQKQDFTNLVKALLEL